MLYNELFAGALRKIFLDAEHGVLVYIKISKVCVYNDISFSIID